KRRAAEKALFDGVRMGESSGAAPEEPALPRLRAEPPAHTRPQRRDTGTPGSRQQHRQGVVIAVRRVDVVIADDGLDAPGSGQPRPQRRDEIDGCAAPGGNMHRPTAVTPAFAEL